MLTRLHPIPLLLLAALVMGGCGDDQGVPPTAPKPRPVTELASPEITLWMLHQAYEARDSVAAGRVYDTDYTGTSTDLNDPPGSQTLNFTRANEIAHVGALMRSPSVTGVTCDLGYPPSWIRLPSDDLAHPDWALIRLAGANIRIEIDGGASIVQAGGASEMMSFYFAPHPDTASPTGVRWKVIRWVETRAGVP